MTNWHSWFHVSQSGRVPKALAPWAKRLNYSISVATIEDLPYVWARARREAVLITHDKDVLHGVVVPPDLHKGTLVLPT